MKIIKGIKDLWRHDRNIKRILAEQDKQLMQISKLLEDQRINMFKEKVLFSKEKGISEERLCDHEVVVSLTSFGKRIFDVPIAIESIMQGTVKPNRIVLWLSKEEFKGKPLPKMLENQIKRGLQIEYCEDFKSYNKLIHALKKYPEACVITIDDDAAYEWDLVERMIAAHKVYPNAICTCRMLKVKLNKEGKPLSYLEWDECVEEYNKDSTLYFPQGIGGVLYPPHCFNDELFNQNVFMDLCPYADDVWFYAMRLLSGTPVTQVYTGQHTGYYVDLQSKWINALSKKNTNSTNCLNDVQIKAVFEKYGLYEKLS